MKADEERIKQIQLFFGSVELRPMVLALCEIARQLARIADAYEIAQGMAPHEAEKQTTEP